MALDGLSAPTESESTDAGAPGVVERNATTYYYLGGVRVGMRQGVVGQGRDSVSWLHADHLGSLSEATTGSGGVSSRQRYFPYGRVRYSSGSPPTTYNFSGQRLDSAVGLLYYGARFYDSYLNRWIQPDSIVPNPADPQSLNRFAYGRNNPVKYTDPTGHVPCYGHETAEECSWGGTGHHSISKQGRRRDIAKFTKYMLKQVQLEGTSDLEAFVQVLDFAAVFGTSTREWADDISSVVTGYEGPNTLGWAAFNPNHYHAPEFGDGGFHPAYQDKQNQVFHWWAYVNQVAQGGSSVNFGTRLINLFHETIDFIEPFGAAQEHRRGASWEDEQLARNGMDFGWALYTGQLTPDTAPAAARQALTTYQGPSIYLPNELRPSNWFTGILEAWSSAWTGCVAAGGYCHP